MKNLMINFLSMIVLMSDKFLSAAISVVITMAILWLIGYLFPFVSAQLGLPHETVYEFLITIPDTILAAVDFIKGIVKA